ncbi:glutamic-type intramembrane protease PrsW [Alkalicoccus chagannorensis]|uniref:glutamic-type intramembrane protease PrsW n=1 Tax=Alkalicoccus chagannorensis TaxID=427072 RepID=UPI0003FF9DF0|nr:glutamic-type intramembrane protease PrsW [Alkalicoccus chagannorensis]
MFILILTAAAAPAAALLFFFYMKDEFEQEPPSFVLKCFFLGGMLVVPALFLQYALSEAAEQTSVVHAAAGAGIEEFFKWFLLLVFVYPHAAMNQRYDGIVYAAAAGLGFASVENVLYLTAYGLDTAFYRALFPVSGHALFGVVMGYYFGRAKFAPDKKGMFLTAALIFPLLLHAGYNAVLRAPAASQWLLPAFMLVLWGAAVWKVKRANTAQRMASQRET